VTCRTATRCNTLQHAATHCNALFTELTRDMPHYSTLQHATTHCNTLQHTATHCITLHNGATHRTQNSHVTCRTATHCNTLQHTATRCNALFTKLTRDIPRYATQENSRQPNRPWRQITPSANQIHLLDTLQHTATHCNTHCSTLQHTAFGQSVLSSVHAATCCNTLQHTATHCNKPAAHCNTLQSANPERLVWSSENCSAAYIHTLGLTSVYITQSGSYECMNKFVY